MKAWLITWEGAVSDVEITIPEGFDALEAGLRSTIQSLAFTDISALEGNAEVSLLFHLEEAQITIPYPLYHRVGEELIIFFQTEQGKLLSLCAREDDGSLVYRFGTDLDVEFKYPDDRERDSQDQFSLEYHPSETKWVGTFSSVTERSDEYSVSFENDDYTYIISDRILWMPEWERSLAITVVTPEGDEYPFNADAGSVLGGLPSVILIDNQDEPAQVLMEYLQANPKISQIGL